MSDLTTTEADHRISVAAGRQARTARAVTELFAPWVLIISLFLAVGWSTGERGVAWGLLGAAFASMGPMTVIVAGVIVGRYTDHHLTTREQRVIPLVLSLIMVVTGIFVLHVLNAPADVLAVEAAMLGGLVVTAPITALWKVSFHTGVASAAVTILAIVYGPVLIALSPIVVLIGWSRVKLAHHTPLQVLLGAPIGTLAATVPFLLVR
ncbi:hypothetical protein SAMN04489712_1435 [Thermomonospora echinospora]|uniref:PAP2 superfamily protein n=1 Tax=Thermomonospora echinospora TaxID=1992 RepID=A0A1H6EAD1_9ACTN|nr:phosphoesterase PA-phosphatase [Thermomonospora echinospora]SEG94079.1 hypothetical protein SAMN04489712_1435 [Thermomonospora echinospora]